MTSPTTASRQAEEIGTEAPSPGVAPRRRIAPALAAATSLLLCTRGIEDRPLWLDESFTLGATNQLQATLTGTGGTMAVYYVALTGWTRVAGDSMLALRLPSAFMVAGAVLVTATWARRSLRGHELWIAAIVLAALPSLVRYGQEARSYGLVILVTAGSWAVLTRAVTATEAGDDARARPWWAALALLAVAGETAHGLFALQVAACGLSLLWLPRRRAHLRAFAATGGAVVAVAIILATQGAGAVADWIPPLGLSQVATLATDVSGPGVVAVVILSLAGIGAASLLRRAAPDPLVRWLHVAPVLWALLPPAILLVVSVARPYLLGRYVLASGPALALLAGVGAVATDRALFRRTRTARRRPGTIGPAAVVLVAALVAGQVALAHEPGHAWDEAAETVATQARPGDALLFPMPTLRSPFEAAWRDLDAPPDGSPLLISSDRPLGAVHRLDDYWDRDEVEEALAGADRLWIIHATDPGWGDRELDRTLEWPPVGDDFRVVRRSVHPGGIQILLLAHDRGSSSPTPPG